MEAINVLVAYLKKFPGLGIKSARRIAYYLLRQDSKYLAELGTLIASLKKNLYTCGQCGNISGQDPCSICSDPLRDRKTLCIVEDIEALSAFEDSGSYNGLYHIVGRVSPLDNEDLSEDALEFLAEHVRALGVQEVIIATSSRVEGEMTFYALLETLKNIGVKKITRIAYGLPVGGSIEFADRTTLSTALEGRREL